MRVLFILLLVCADQVHSGCLESKCSSHHKLNRTIGKFVHCYKGMLYDPVVVPDDVHVVPYVEPRGVGALFFKHPSGVLKTAFAVTYDTDSMRIGYVRMLDNNSHNEMLYFTRHTGGILLESDVGIPMNNNKKYIASGGELGHVESGEEQRLKAEIMACSTSGCKTTSDWGLGELTSELRIGPYLCKVDIVSGKESPSCPKCYTACGRPSQLETCEVVENTEIKLINLRFRRALNMSGNSTTTRSSTAAETTTDSKSTTTVAPTPTKEEKKSLSTFHIVLISAASGVVFTVLAAIVLVVCLRRRKKRKERAKILRRNNKKVVPPSVSLD